MARTLKQKEDRTAGKKTKGKKEKQQETICQKGELTDMDDSADNRQAVAATSVRRQAGEVLAPPSDQGLAPTTCSALNIDPALLSEEQVGPALRRTGGIQPEQPVGAVIINEQDMQFLKPLGYAGVMPVNGLNNGPAICSMPAAAMDLLQQQQVAQQQSSQNNHIALTDPPQTRQK